jgi:hypothetical protein
MKRKRDCIVYVNVRRGGFATTAFNDNAEAPETLSLELDAWVRTGQRKRIRERLDAKRAAI